MNKVRFLPKIIVAASVSLALAFTLSCSGEDGIDGADGTDGKDADCMFEPKPQTDSLLIICNNKLVGVIINGKDGSDGTDGKDGKDGADGTDGKDGADGTDGKDGADGTDGKDGADGTDGKDGADGTDGKDGADGTDGKDGADGKDGLSCDVADAGVYFVMRCGGIEKARWAKAMCGASAYNPTEMTCNNSVLSFSFSDVRDNKRYKAVIIGTQTWMAQNLNYSVSGSICHNNSEPNCNNYGRLYNWAMATTVCPPGWRLPNDAEWSALINFIGSSVGTKLKAKEGWNDHSSGKGTDDYGFSAMPGGISDDSGFSGLGYYSYLWSATELGTTAASVISIYYNRNDTNRAPGQKNILISVRCVKN